MFDQSQLEVVRALEKLAVNFNAAYPQERLVLAGVEQYRSCGKFVMQVGSLESTIDQAMSHLMYHFVRTEQDTPAYKQLTQWIHTLGDMRSWLMTPYYARGRARDFAMYHQRRNAVSALPLQPKLSFGAAVAGHIAQAIGLSATKRPTPRPLLG